MNIVFDTNVLLSASFTPGTCASLVKACLVSDSKTVVVSQFILDEFIRHGVSKFGGPKDRVRLMAQMILERAVMVTPTPVGHEVFDDADDLPILGTAEAGGAAYLITGDQALLRLSRYREVEIVTPREFLGRVRG